MNKGLKIGKLVFEIGDKADELLKVIRQISADIHIHLFNDKSSDYQIDILAREYIDKLIKNIDDEKPGEVAFTIIKSLVINKGEYTVSNDILDKKINLNELYLTVDKQVDQSGDKTVIVKFKDYTIVSYSKNYRDGHIENLIVNDKVTYKRVDKIIDTVATYLIKLCDEYDNYPYNTILNYDIINIAIDGKIYTMSNAPVYNG